MVSTSSFDYYIFKRYSDFYLLNQKVNKFFYLRYKKDWKIIGDLFFPLKKYLETLKRNY